MCAFTANDCKRYHFPPFENVSGDLALVTGKKIDSHGNSNVRAISITPGSPVDFYLNQTTETYWRFLNLLFFCFSIFLMALVCALEDHKRKVGVRKFNLRHTGWEKRERERVNCKWTSMSFFFWQKSNVIHLYIFYELLQQHFIFH